MQPDTMQDINQEERLQLLAQDESDALAALELAVKGHDAEIRNVEASFAGHIGPLIEAEAAARVALHNAIVDSPGSLWAKRKTRTHGLCKYGWRKRRGKLTIVDEARSIERLERQLGMDAARRCVKVKRSLVRRELNTLPADVLRKCGVAVESDTDEVVVESTASELARRVEKLRDDAVVDLPPGD